MRLDVMLSVVALCCVSAAVARATESDEAATPVRTATHEVAAEIVSVDVENKKLTVKTDEGRSTVGAEGKAESALIGLKRGQQVTLVCRDGEDGAHQAVTEIRSREERGIY